MLHVYYAGDVPITTSYPTCSNAARITNIQRLCRDRNQVNSNTSFKSFHPKTYEMLMIDEKHKLIYCVVPKAACTTWKTILKDATDNPKAKHTNPHDLSSMRKVLQLPMMSHLNISDIRSKLLSPDYFKLLVVRHPIDRLISAFREKVVRGNYNPWISKYIKTHVRKRRNSFDNKLTWREFVSFLVKEQGEGTRSVYNLHANDIHWRRQVDLSHPCCISYNHVIKVETMEHDAPPVLDLLYNAKRGLPKLHLSARTEERNAIVKEYQDLPPTIKTGLINRYMDDFRLFGYNVTEEGRFVCKVVGSAQSPCC